jgi:hypothetical protein
MKNEGMMVVICLVGVSLGVASSCGAQAAERQSEFADNIGALTSLQSELFVAKDDRARLDALSRIAEIGGAESTAFLREYFQKIPLPDGSTNPKRDSFREMALGVILPALMGEEKNGFITAVIRQEAQGLRDAASVGVDIYYPKGVWTQSLAALDQSVASEAVLKELSEISNDRGVPDQIRVALKTSLYLRDVGSDEGSVSKSIRSMIDSMPIMPMTSIMPYEIYMDKDKRIAYASRAEYKEKGEQYFRWRISGEQAKYNTVESVLLRFGLASVREIVAVLQSADVPKERKECLAMLATSLLSRMSVQKKGKVAPIDEESRLLATALDKFVDNMDDPGMFSYRFRAEQSLNIFCRNTETPKFQFSSGLRAMNKKLC